MELTSLKIGSILSLSTSSKVGVNSSHVPRKYGSHSSTMILGAWGHYDALPVKEVSSRTGPSSPLPETSASLRWRDYIFKHQPSHIWLVWVFDSDCSSDGGIFPFSILIRSNIWRLIKPPLLLDDHLTKSGTCGYLRPCSGTVWEHSGKDYPIYQNWISLRGREPRSLSRERSEDLRYQDGSGDWTFSE